MTIFDYQDSDAVGSVFTVDTASVVIQVEDPVRLRTIQVNRLVVLRSARAGQHLVGMVQKILRRALVGDATDEHSEREDVAAVIENVLKVALIGTLIDLVGKQPNVFRRTLETVPEIDAKCFLLEGDRLSRFMKAIATNARIGDPAASAGASTASKPLVLGRYTLDDQADALLDGDRFFQRHAAIVGSTGSGKSWAVARLLEQIASLPSANAVLFDIHGEYSTLAGPGVRHLRVAGPDDLDGSKGLADGVVHLPHWLLTYDEMLALLLDRSDQNAPNQASLFSQAVRDAKDAYLTAAGKTELQAQFTIDSPVSYELSSVIDALEAKDTEMIPGKTTEKQGPFYGKLTRFLSRLRNKQSDRRLGFMFSESEDRERYEWMTELCQHLLAPTSRARSGGVKVLNVSEVPADVLPLILGLIARVIFSAQQWMDPGKRHPVALMCDEAHLYIPERSEGGSAAEAGFKSFERIAKEGRKYGVGLVVITQRPAEVNRTILSQCNNFMAMRLTNGDDQATIRRLLPDDLGGFSDVLPVLDVGEALVVGDASLLPTRVRIDPPTTKPNSATVAFWQEWSKTSVADGVGESVEAMRRQRRG